MAIGTKAEVSFQYENQEGSPKIVSVCFLCEKGVLLECSMNTMPLKRENFLFKIPSISQLKAMMCLFWQKSSPLCGRWEAAAFGAGFRMWIWGNQLFGFPLCYLVLVLLGPDSCVCGCVLSPHLSSFLLGILRCENVRISAHMAAALWAPSLINMQNSVGLGGCLKVTEYDEAGYKIWPHS